MSEDTVLTEIFTFLERHDTTVDCINFNKEVPEFKLSIKNQEEGSTDLDILLKEFYKIFWVLTYGAPTDSNKDKKVEIKYQLL